MIKDVIIDKKTTPTWLWYWAGLELATLRPERGRYQTALRCYLNFVRPHPSKVSRFSSRTGTLGRAGTGNLPLNGRRGGAHKGQGQCPPA
jgi:hypothetical protein